ncbi:MAG: lytic transglycosylase domain-containing protein [Spirochaetes bacterium]|jgi:soluble lytic murein transglycosylase-like protein|nr:lytic transglycosylase domain-containing protein [Spirochaetota bacterium]
MLFTGTNRFNSSWFAALLIPAFFLIEPVISDARIYKKISGDGSVEYYNKNEEVKPRKPVSIQKTVYDEMIDRISTEVGLDPFLVKCIIKIESDFNPDAVSTSGAMGLMQLMQDTAKIYGVRDPLDPIENLKAGTRHFKTLMKYFKDDIPLALAAYHAGLGRVSKNNSIPPIKATIDYVNAIMTLYGREGNYTPSIKKLYKKIEKDGSILIYSR